MSLRPSGRTVVLQEKGCLIISIQSPLSDADLRSLFMEVARLNPHDFEAAIVDLSGMDVVDSFSSQSLQNLCRLLQLYGIDPVISGIQNGIALSMALRGLDIKDTPVTADLEDAFTYVANRPRRRHHSRHHREGTHKGHGGRHRR